MGKGSGWPMRVAADATHVGTARINHVRTAPAKHEVSIAVKKTPKYRNKKVNVDGMKFDSSREYQHYLLLKMREEAGEIGDLQRQTVFLLLPNQRRADGSLERKVEYWADFTYVENGQYVVEDVKSEPTRKLRGYIDKRKMMLWFHGISIKEVT